VKRARSIRRTAVSSRRHIILVPGFAGFDALGQLEYYAGVTPLFPVAMATMSFEMRAVRTALSLTARRSRSRS